MPRPFRFPCPLPVVATLACALVLVLPQPAAAQDDALTWSDPDAPVLIPEEQRTRGLRATDAPTADGQPVNGSRSFVPIAPIVPRPVQTGPRTWQLCNASRFDRVSIAIAVPEQREWLVRGWLMLDQGDCQVVLRDSMANEVYYLAHPARGRLPGWQVFCIRTDSGFQTVATRQCPDGYVEAGFRRVELDAAMVRTDIR
jgi:uncharacterized membrane protein